MSVKEKIKGYWRIASSILLILVVGGLLLFAFGTIGDVLFKLFAAIQSNIGKLLLAGVAIWIIVWVIKNKGEG